MRLLVVLFASAALCAGIVIPQVPEDNSHYVEGESRYIWMPDGEGTPHLVDLQAPPELDILEQTRNGNNNAYWLFTRRNQNSRQVLVNGNANSIRNSNYNGNRPLIMVTHGWNAKGSDNWISQVVSAFLANSDCNVIVVDWNRAASGVYSTSVNAVPDVGRHIGNFITFLFNTAGGNWNNVHLTGHSLGAHVMGNAGRAVSGRVARVTGLDPAGPQWGGNSNALNRQSGQYVECIHTDGGRLGINDPICDGNFYPNGGRNPQPGCRDNNCSHGRAPLLLASSVRTNHFVGRLCSNLNQAHNNQCSGSSLNMGNNVFNKRGSGIYGLRTGSSWPF